MASKNRWLTCMVLVLLLALSFILYLELGSRLYFGRQTIEDPGPAAPAPVCDLEHYPPDPRKGAVLEELIQIRSRGDGITPLDLDRAITLVPQSEMPGLNGVLCNDMIFLSQRLEGPARYYVARHELEHVFQQAGLDPQCRDRELCATWKAAAEYPLGLVAAIGSSLREAYRSYPSMQEFLFGSWLVFKYYLLP
jgi:hypothetical protein